MCYLGWNLFHSRKLCNSRQCLAVALQFRCYVDGCTERNTREIRRGFQHVVEWRPMQWTTEPSESFICRQHQQPRWHVSATEGHHVCDWNVRQLVSAVWGCPTVLSWLIAGRCLFVYIGANLVCWDWRTRKMQSSENWRAGTSKGCDGSDMLWT